MIALVPWVRRMFERLRPILGSYAQEAWDQMWRRLFGSEPPIPPSANGIPNGQPGGPILQVGFPVVNPKLNDAVDALTLRFCEETNATTSQALSDALEQVRDALRQGTVEGLAIKDLTNRVNEVFDQASEFRAERIAITESSRAVHMAQDLSAKSSGVVWGHEWLASADACDRCRALAGKRVPLGTPFVTGASTVPEYADVFYPPLHPHDQCTVVEVLLSEHAEFAPASPISPSSRA